MNDEMASEETRFTKEVQLSAFLDANIVLEGRPLAELPWEGVQSDGTIIALIVPKAMEEIDAKKRDGRLGPVARAFNQLIAHSVINGVPVVIREAGPRVELAMAVCNRIPWNDYDELDPDDGDSRIVAEALNARNVNPNHRVLISHDIKPLAYARGRGLRVHRASDAWLRAIEPGPKDKEIQRLKQQVSELRKDEPSFNVQIALSDIDPLEILKISELSDNQSSTLLSKLENLSRRESQGSYIGGMNIPSVNHDYSYEHRFDRYLSHTLPGFVERFSEKMELLCNQRHLSIAVTNIGQIRADHLVIEVETNDGWLNKRTVFVSPKGPVPPSPRSLLDNMPNINRMMRHQVGRHEFDFTTKAQRSPTFVATCEDFRSGQEFVFDGVLTPSTRAGDLEITVKLTAANMRGNKCDTFRWGKVITEADVAAIVDLETLEVIVAFPVANAIDQFFSDRNFDDLELDKEAEDDND